MSRNINTNLEKLNYKEFKKDQYDPFAQSTKTIYNGGLSFKKTEEPKELTPQGSPIKLSKFMIKKVK